MMALNSLGSSTNSIPATRIYPTGLGGIFGDAFCLPQRIHVSLYVQPSHHRRRNIFLSIFFLIPKMS